MALRRPVEGVDAELASSRAKTLERQVADGEGRVHRELLGDDSQHIDLRYVLQSAPARDATALPAGQIHAGEHPSPGEGSLPDMPACYRATRPARPRSSSPARPERARQLDCEHRKALQFA
ncbi:hypothetical protein [Streptomyces uncialis]|uniref:hypothetical protein n=1 Tax=Streptomyces uncialis TaxID=1048205 RepID=UPI002254E040|nr:hypothetical protein [Streptomyces uncialis]MCX4659284.1 hypothetical protein [Streptomyces uncialis]